MAIQVYNKKWTKEDGTIVFETWSKKTDDKGCVVKNVMLNKLERSPYLEGARD